MTKKQLQINANTDFVGRVQTAFKAWCMRKGKHPTPDNFVKYLIRHSFISETLVNRFLCLEYYAETLPTTINNKRPNGVKDLTVWTMEDKLPLRERQIKSNLCHHSTYFKDNYSRLP